MLQTVMRTWAAALWRSRRASLRRGRSAALVLAAACTCSCYNFRLFGPEDPPAVANPALVSLTVVYQQPRECGGPPDRCDEPVRFYGSWMQPGTEFTLVRDPGNHVWRGTAYAVPVNFPPTGYPHEVRVFDPHMLNYPTEGMTAERLWIGGERVVSFVYPNDPRVFGEIYVDQDGAGHSPF
jgi:hypothetical protein